MIDVILGVIPLVLVVAFILLIFRSMDGQGSTVDRMKQAVGGTVMLLVALLVIFAFVGGSSPGPGPEPEPMDASLFTYTVVDGNATVTGWASTPPENGYDLYFPDTDGDGNPVISIAGASPSPWMGAKSIRSNSAETIQSDAFFYCDSLKSVSLPAATSIGANAFRNCTSLTSVSLPVATSIGNEAFNYCASLKSVSLPAATSIGTNVFYDCNSLKSVSLPAATSIGSQAFRHCTSLTSVSLPVATSIGSDAFNNCTSLKSVSLPAITNIGTAALRDTALVSVSLPVATTIGYNAFRACGSLKSVSLPAVTNIGSNVFSECLAITSITFGPLDTVSNSSFSSWIFYDEDGTTVLSKTAANLADSTFQGTASALIKVPAGQQSLSSEMRQRALELAEETQHKFEMLAYIDPALAEMDPTEVAKMTFPEIRALTTEDIEEIKSSIAEEKAARGE